MSTKSLRQQLEEARKTITLLHEELMEMNRGMTALDLELEKRIDERTSALSASEARYRNTLNSMLEGCQIIAYDWRYLYVNDASAVHGKKSKEELLGHTMMECYPGIEKTDMFAVLKRCMEEQTSCSIENEFIYPDNSQSWFELGIYSVPEGICILSIDITERRLAEEEIRKLAKFPAENPNPVMRVTPDGSVIYANTPAMNLLKSWKSGIGQHLPENLCELCMNALTQNPI
ncbi:PAS domain-containing protein, partial [bacterium]|nr:PAS domain-containing protein [bacterium]